MTSILELRERLKGFYSSFEFYAKPLLKFVCALLSLWLIASNIGFMNSLTNPGVILIIALVCAFLPVNGIVFIHAVVVLVHLYALSMEYALIMLGVFAVLFLLYFRFAHEYGYVLWLMPVACALHIPAAVPLVMGLVAGPLTVIPVVCGTFVYYLLEYARTYANALSSLDVDQVFARYEYILEHGLHNVEMYLTMIALAAVLLLVHAIRRLSVDYAWQIAIAAGAIADVIIMLIGDYVLGVSVSLVTLVIGVVVSALIAFLVQFFVFSLDYTRTERVQFEDDEYYYYVKAVPKKTIAVKDKSVKRIIINRRRSETADNGAKAPAGQAGSNQDPDGE